MWAGFITSCNKDYDHDRHEIFEAGRRKPVPFTMG